MTLTDSDQVFELIEEHERRLQSLANDLRCRVHTLGSHLDNLYINLGAPLENERPIINPLGEVQQSGQSIDRLCAQIAAERDLLAELQRLA